jgi:Putative amidoligase enzyme
LGDCCTCEEDVGVRYRDLGERFHGEPSPRYPRYLGVEIECGMDGTTERRGDTAPLDRACRTWGAGITDDGSVGVDAYIRSAEIVTAPARGESFIRQIDDVVGAIRQCGGKVNRSCGLHVHVDARDLTLAHVLTLVRLYERIERTMYSLVSRSRRTNHFCGPWGDALIKGEVSNPDAPITVRERDLDVNTYGDERTARSVKSQRSKHGCRYHGFNVNALHCHGTVEFRLHQGTTDPRKIKMWAAVCTMLVEYAAAHTEAEVMALRGTPAEILEKILVGDREVLRWTRARRRFFDEQDRVRRGLPPRAARARPAAEPEPEEPAAVVEAGEVDNDGVRLGRRAH